MKSDAPQKGFALIDLIVALAIAGLIFASIAALFQFLTRAALRLEAAGGAQQTAQQTYVTFARLGAMFEGALLLSNSPLGCTGLTGTATELMFVTAAAPQSAGLGPMTAMLSADRAGEGGLWLTLLPVSAAGAEDEPEPLTTPLLHQTGAVSFAYRAPAYGEIGTLRAAWTEACTPPAAVEITLSGEPGETGQTFAFPLEIDRAANLR